MSESGHYIYKITKPANYSVKYFMDNMFALCHYKAILQMRNKWGHAGDSRPLYKISTCNRSHLNSHFPNTISGGHTAMGITSPVNDHSPLDTNLELVNRKPKVSIFSLHNEDK